MANEVTPLDPSQFEDAAPSAQPLDSSQFEDVPAYANGLAPDTAINKSPLSVEDRFALANGNKAGRLKMLKSKFEDAAADKDGNFVVKSQGLWHKVDGTTFEDVDPWTATKGVIKSVGSMGLLTLGMEKQAMRLANSNPTSKEIMSDYADILPGAVSLGASVLAGQVTGGASLLGQAAVAGATAGAAEGLRTSLGRLEGTYDATPTEQAADIGFESLLNFAGVTVTAGVKPTAEWVGERLPFLAKAYNSMADGSKSVIKKVYGALTVGEDNLDTVLEDAPAVKEAMKSAAEATANGGNYADELVNRNVGHIKRLAQKSKEVLNKIYTKMSSSIVDGVDGSFQASLDDVASPIYQDAIQMGMGNIVKRGKALSPADAMRLLEEGGGKLPKGFKFILKSPEELRQMQKASGAIDDVTNTIIDPETHTMLSNFFDQLGELTSRRNLTGPEGARQLLNFKKVLNDVTYTLKYQADEKGINTISHMMAKYHDLVDSSVASHFEQQGLGGAYSALNESYHGLSAQVASLQNALRASGRQGGSEVPFQTLLNQVNAQDGRNVVQKLGITNLLKAAEHYGLEDAAVIKGAQRAIRINQAAIAFNPIVKRNLVGQGSLTLAAGAALSGNPTVALTLGAGAAASSPRGALYATQLADSMWKGKDFISRLTRDQLKAFVNRPDLVNGFVNAVIQTPLIQDHVQQQLLAPIQGQQQ